MKTTFVIHGTHCNACKMILEENLQEVPGVHSVAVDYQTGQTILGHEDEVAWEALQKAIEDAGDYSVSDRPSLPE